MSNIPERTQKYIKGLTDFIDYIDRQIPVKDLTILEIGAWTGIGSITFAKRFKEVHCVDIWKKDKRCLITVKYDINKVEKIFDERKKKYKNIFKYKGDWKHFAKIFKSDDKCFDVIYVDMNKIFEENLNCLLAFYPLTREFISGHDYEDRFSGVKKAVNKIFGRPQLVFPDTSWIVKINKFIGGKEYGNGN